MIALISLFIVVVASMLVTRIATRMLIHTGMSQESAQFQARSAFTGAGFTTAESEAVINHPVRRRIIRTLILLGNAGIITVLASLLLSFTGSSGSGDAFRRMVLIAAGLALLFRLARSRFVDKVVSRIIDRSLARFTDLDVQDYAGLLRLDDDWIVAELLVDEGDWFCGYTLRELALPEEGVVVLGIQRAHGRWVGAPKSTAQLHTGDVVTLYGRRPTIDRIDARQRDVEGEHDWIASQVEFTETYLEQQRHEHEEQERTETEGDEPTAS